MNSEILITVIIPAYNVSEWIERCLGSVTKQTYRNLEIIVIDDGSTDNTGELIDRFAELDDRIIPVHQDNSGLIEVRETGILMAHGAYIGFVDGDDEIEPEMYERLINNALKYQADISQCGILYCFYDGQRIQRHGTNELMVFGKTEGCVELLKGKIMEPSLCNKIYKKEILIDSCPDKTIINNEDFLRNFILFSRCEKSVFEDFCGYHYWRRTGSMSNNKNIVKIGNNILKARKMLLEKTDGELKIIAMESYFTALISFYNQLINSKNEQEVALRCHCLNEMSFYKSDSINLSRSINLKVNAILKFPVLYNFAYNTYRVYRSVKNKYDSAKASKESENR